MIEVLRDDRGDVLAVVHCDQPLSELARDALADITAVIISRMQAEDPDDLLGDKQIRALDRLHKRHTPECGAEQGDLICTRPAMHRRYGTRHVTACGTQRWQDERP